MLAAVLEAPRQVLLHEVPTPEPGPGQVRVRLEGSGICASELPVWEGRRWFDYPRPAGEPGHEGWGRVDAVGPEVDLLSPGDRVAVLSHRAHAEFDLADQDSVLVLPPELPAGTCFPAEPAACALNAFRRANVQPGDRVAVVGCGFQGLLLVQLCRGLAAEVLAVSRREDSLERARSCGATRTWREQDGGLNETFDVVFEATGHQGPLELAGRLTAVRGRLVIVGYHQDGRRSVDMQLWNWRGIDVINAHERDPGAYLNGMRGAMQAVVDGELDLTGLLTHTFSLEEISAAYRLAHERPAGFVKAVWVNG